MILVHQRGFATGYDFATKYKSSNELNRTHAGHLRAQNDITLIDRLSGWLEVLNVFCLQICEFTAFTYISPTFNLTGILHVPLL